MLRIGSRKWLDLNLHRKNEWVGLQLKVYLSFLLNNQGSNSGSLNAASQLL